MIHQLSVARQASQRALLLALAITISLLVAEVIGGLLTGSLALLADAGHMLSDVAALGFSVFAIWLAMRPASATRTYGLHRVEILAALANGAGLVAVALAVFWQAAERFRDPPEIESLPMLLVATAGLAGNAASGLILHRHAAGSLNVRGAYLHVVGDALGSVGAVSAGIVMLSRGWYLADPIISVFIGVLILVSSGRLLGESLGVLLEAVPPHIDTREVERALCELPGVTGVHDLHVWTVTSGFVALSCHCEVEPKNDVDELLVDVCQMLHRRFGIHHVTIQPESRRLSGWGKAHSLPRCESVVTEDAETAAGGG